MDLNNEIDINAPVDVVWETMNDVERIAPCLPGAQLREVDEASGEYRGIVKVKVGPITAQYMGVATFVEQNADSKRVTLEAKGRDSRGAGTADARITATLREKPGNTTRLMVDTDLTVTGKVAQFGRGALADVSGKLMGQFADNLEAMLDESQQAPAASGTPRDAESATSTATSTAPTPAQESQTATSVRFVDAPEAEPVDLVEIAGGSLAKRVAPVVVVIVALVVAWWLIRRMTE